jgi:hypothetical protein
MDFPRIDNVDIMCPICGKLVSTKGNKEMAACQWVMISVLFMDFLTRNNKGGGHTGSDNYKKPTQFGV